MSETSIFARDFDRIIAEERENSRKQRHESEYPPERVSQMVREATEEGLREGYRKGLEDGREEVRADISASLSAALGNISPVIEKLSGELSRQQERVERDLSDFLLTLLEKVVPEAIHGYNDERIRNEVRAVARRAQGSRWIEIRVSPKISDLAQEALKSVLHEGAGIEDVRIIPDESLGITEVMGAWSGGRSAYSYERLCNRLMETLRADIRDRKELKGNGE